MNEQILYSRPAAGARLNMAHPLTKGLVGCWMLNDKGMRAMDLSPYARHGVMTGFSPMQQAHNGLRFNAAPYITIPHDARYSVGTTGKLSVEVWFETTVNAQTVTGGDILSKYTATGNQREWSVYESGGGATRLRLCQLDNTQIALVAIVSPPPNTIGHFIGTVVDGVAIKSYKDGVLVGSDATFSAPIQAGTSDVTIGLTTLVAPMDGKIYLVRIWNRDLSALEALQLHNAPYEMVLNGD